MVRMFNTPAAGLPGLAVQARTYLSEREFAEGEGDEPLDFSHMGAVLAHGILTLADPGTMIERHESTFLMTPAQHREWARILHSKGKPEKAQHHEPLARAIEIAVVAASPRSPRPTVAPVDNPPGRIANGRMTAQ